MVNFGDFWSKGWAFWPKSTNLAILVNLGHRSRSKAGSGPFWSKFDDFKSAEFWPNWPPTGLRDRKSRLLKSRDFRRIRVGTTVGACWRRRLSIFRLYGGGLPTATKIAGFQNRRFQPFRVGGQPEPDGGAIGLRLTGRRCTCPVDFGDRPSALQKPTASKSTGQGNEPSVIFILIFTKTKIAKGKGTRRYWYL